MYRKFHMEYISKSVILYSQNFSIECIVYLHTQAREAQPGRAELWRCLGYKFKSYLEHQFIHHKRLKIYFTYIFFTTEYSLLYYSYYYSSLLTTTRNYSMTDFFISYYFKQNDTQVTQTQLNFIIIYFINHFKQNDIQVNKWTLHLIMNTMYKKSFMFRDKINRKKIW